MFTKPQLYSNHENIVSSYIVFCMKARNLVSQKKIFGTMICGSEKQKDLPSGDIATPCGFVNSPRLRPRFPTFRTRSSSIGLFREQALSTKDLEKENNNKTEHAVHTYAAGKG